VSGRASSPPSEDNVADHRVDQHKWENERPTPQNMKARLEWGAAASAEPSDNQFDEAATDRDQKKHQLSFGWIFPRVA
jgi:hypothetical protein